ncbi:hypothetical protein AeMF1_008531 [Aphanomyces euteiches]|nr:hypothetical protein AeMF1_008531 [Aphanomyces euteiches]
MVSRWHTSGPRIFGFFGALWIIRRVLNVVSTPSLFFHFFSAALVVSDGFFFGPLTLRFRNINLLDAEHIVLHLVDLLLRRTELIIVHQESVVSVLYLFQSNEAFYKRVKDCFDQRMSGSSASSDDRSSVSLSSRFHTISHDVSKYVACIRKIRGVNGMGPSGSSEDDIRLAATKLFESRKENGRFKYLDCWFVLRNEPKWQEWFANDPKAKKSKETKRPRSAKDTNGHNEETLEESKPSNGEATRPIGMKRQKAKISKRSC